MGSRGEADAAHDRRRGQEQGEEDERRLEPHARAGALSGPHDPLTSARTRG